MKKTLLLLSFLLFTIIAFAQNTAQPTIEESTAALKTLLLSEEIQTYFPGNNTIFILTNNEICAQLRCQHFELKEGEQKVFMGNREELFMRSVKKWLEIGKIHYNVNNEVIIDYTIKNIH